MAKGKYLAPPTKREKRVFATTVIFYALYFLMLAALCIGLHMGLSWLSGWLADYEAAQPNVRCQEIFDELYADPDWAELYTLAGLQETQYETKEAFSQYMEEKCQGLTLSYYETSAGLSGDHKYIVKAGDEKVSVFTLTTEDDEAEIPQWVLGSVELFPEFAADITICTAPDRVVFINGLALTDEHTVKTLSTVADAYLPEGIHGLQRRWQYVNGLLMLPEVTAYDAEGNAVELIYDEATNTFSEAFEEVSISDEEIDNIVKAAKVYCKFMLGVSSRNDLNKYFDRNADFYSSIVRDEWLQNYNGYSFSDYTVSSYYRYSDTLYSAKLTMTMNVTRTNGSIKEFPLDTTFFMEKTSGGWIVVNMTNVDVQEQTTLVRMTYMVDDEVLEVRMTDAFDGTLEPPAVTAPEGKSFIGWYRQQIDAVGNINYSLAFLPDENGLVYLSEDTELEPMILYALFDTKEAE